MYYVMFIKYLFVQTNTSARIAAMDLFVLVNESLRMLVKLRHYHSSKLQKKNKNIQLQLHVSMKHNLKAAPYVISTKNRIT